MAPMRSVPADRMHPQLPRVPRPDAAAQTIPRQAGPTRAGQTPGEGRWAVPRRAARAPGGRSANGVNQDEAVAEEAGVPSEVAGRGDEGAVPERGAWWDAGAEADVEPAGGVGARPAEGRPGEVGAGGAGAGPAGGRAG